MFIDGRPIHSTTNPYEKDLQFHAYGIGLIVLGVGLMAGAAYAVRAAH